jgi:tyrosine-protein kinase Etk/Wzc
LQKKLQRQNIFKKFSTSKDPVKGLYELRFYPSGYCSFYHNSDCIDSLKFDKFITDTVSYNGLTFSLNPKIEQEQSRVAFRIKSFRKSVESLRSREKIVTSNTGDLMSIILRDSDPILVTETVNLLADIFVRKSLAMRKENSQFVSNYLREQLALAQRELSKSDYDLKSFRNKHLQGLDQETQGTVNRLDLLENEINRLAIQRDELNLLKNKLDPSVSDFNEGVSTRYIYKQISMQPIFEQDNTMAITREELNDKYKEITELLRRGVPEVNPTVMEIREDIQSIETKIYMLANEKINELDKGIARRERNMGKLQNKLSLLPDEELRLVKLTRQRTANEEIHKLYLRRFMEAQITEAVASENISIIDPAIVPESPIGGNRRKKILIGLFLGLFLGVIAVLFWEIVDKSIKTREDIKRYLKLPILGTIPKVKFDDYELQDSEKAKSISSQIVTHDYSPTPVGEAYRSLRTSILFSKSIGPIRSLVVGSIAPGEGKSFTAANLAIALAQQKSKTLLIDADLRRGVLHNSFNCPKKMGLTNYLTGVIPLESVLNETYIPNLTLIPCGSMIPNPSELLGSMKMKKFIEGITKRFDFVLFDTPPLLAASDAIILGTLVDGVAIVVRAGKTNRDDVMRKLELFQNVQARIIGVILNGAGVEVAHEGYSYYKY